jgi:hypothetical protein
VGYPQKEANTEPSDWLVEAEAWGFPSNSPKSTRNVPMAGVAEMTDRVRADDWSVKLDAVLFSF